MMKKYIGFRLILLLFTFACVFNYAGCNEKSKPTDPDNGDKYEITINWQLTNGPLGGYIRSIATHLNGIIYVGHDDYGILRSLDNCVNWVEVNNGLDYYIITCLETNSQGHIFAGGGMLHHSTDQGENWYEISTLTSAVDAIGINNLDHIYAGGSTGGFFRSFDNGATWDSTGFPNSRPSSIVFNSENHIYVASDSIICSNDNGENWTNLGMNSIGALAINSQDHIFAGGFSGLFRSIDAGSTWVFLADYNVEIIDINSVGHIFLITYEGSIFRSLDNGRSWEDRTPNNPLFYFYIFSVKIDNNDQIFLTTNDGVYCSTDNGDFWKLVGVPASNNIDLTIDKDDRIFATDGLIARSENHGNLWTRLDHGFDDADFSYVAVNSRGTLISGGSSGIYRSFDHGENWESVSEQAVSGFAINSNDHIFAAGRDNGIYCSTNAGVDWQLLGLENISIKDIVINIEGHILAVGTGVHKSTDNGQNWFCIGLENNYSLTSVVVDTNACLYVGTDQGNVYCSKDGGINWIETNFDGYDVTCLITDLNGHVFAGSMSGGVYYTIDYGENWTQVIGGLKDTNVRSLAINSQNNIFAGTYGRGVYKGEIIY